MRLKGLLVILRLIHAQVREQFAALRNFAEQSPATGVIFLMFLQMLRQIIDLLGQNRDLYLRGTGIFFVRLVLIDQLFLLSSLEGHKRE